MVRDGALHFLKWPRGSNPPSADYTTLIRGSHVDAPPRTVYMGGDPSRITFLPIRQSSQFGSAQHATQRAGVELSSPRSQASSSLTGTDAVEDSVTSPTGGRARGYSVGDAEMKDLMAAFSMFDANNSKCFVESDRQRLLGVIESGVGSIDAFNMVIRRLFQGKLGPAMQKLENGKRTRGSALRDSRQRGSLSSLFRTSGPNSPVGALLSRRGSLKKSLMRRTSLPSEVPVVGMEVSNVGQSEP